MTRHQDHTAARQASNRARTARALRQNEARDTAVEAAAQRCLDITLEWRGSDSLDFHDLGVGSLKAALVDAYEAGAAAATETAASTEAASQRHWDRPARTLQARLRRP